jgi:DNA invertase Pin-like site-specific DNA recombinase
MYSLCRRRRKTGRFRLDRRVITLEDWALVRRLAAEVVPKAGIADRLGISRTTVLKAVASDSGGQASVSRRRDW